MTNLMSGSSTKICVELFCFIPHLAASIDKPVSSLVTSLFRIFPQQAEAAHRLGVGDDGRQF
jgi:hypothetical protein